MLLTPEETNKLILSLDSHNVPKSDGLIIDLRDNPGGYSAIPELLAIYLKGHNVRIDDLFENMSIETTKEADILVMNFYILNYNVRKVMRYEVNKREFNNSIREFEKFIKKNKYKKELKVQDTPRIAPGKKYHKPYNKPILVVINNYTASAAEMTTLVLKKEFKTTTVIGTNSSGTLEYGDPGILVLPNSKVMVSIPTMHVGIKQGVNFKEKYGINPDKKLNNDAEINQKIENWLEDFKVIKK